MVIFQFQSTTKRRSIDSAEAFIEGMFGPDSAAVIPVKTRDEVLHVRYLHNNQTDSRHFCLTDSIFFLPVFTIIRRLQAYYRRKRRYIQGEKVIFQYLQYATFNNRS